MQIDAAVVREEGGAFKIESVELDDPKPDEVLIDIAAAGVCHTDISVRDQYYPTPTGGPRPRGIGGRSGGWQERD